SHGDEKQDGLDRQHRHRVQSANRAFRSASADFSLLPFWATDGSGIHDAGSRRGRGLRLRPVSDQRRRRNELDRRHSTSLALYDSRDGFLLLAGAETRRRLRNAIESSARMGRAICLWLTQPSLKLRRGRHSESVREKAAATTRFAESSIVAAYDRGVEK